MTYYRSRGYVFKKGFLWVGWIIVLHDSAEYYYDDSPYLTLHSDPGLVYLTFGFTEKSVRKRMGKVCEKKLLNKYPIKEVNEDD